MKIRVGFVSNSSTSIYICEICGYGVVECQCGCTEGMVWCINGHTLHEECLQKLDIDPSDEDMLESYDGELPETLCPICSNRISIHPEIQKFIKDVHERLEY